MDRHPIGSGGECLAQKKVDQLQNSGDTLLNKNRWTVDFTSFLSSATEGVRCVKD